MASLFRFRQAGRVALDARAWRPSVLQLLVSPLINRRKNELAGLTDRDHLEAAASWLARAQDARDDGGVAGRYHLGRGWSSSYPETTGYIVPTFLALEMEAGLAGYRERARRCIEFLLSVQLPSGAFPGMEIAENRDKPSIFNSAQILHGLTAWHATTGDATTLAAARRTAQWLIDAQDADGAWRRHLYGSGRTYTYMAHAACWLAEFGAHVDDERCLAGARAHLEWLLLHVDDATGWIGDCGFGDEDQRARRAVTHTIAYTIWGTLLLSRILGHTRGLGVARRAAHAVARRLELSQWLPGKLDANWKGAAPYACLTGNAQMALIWFELNRLEKDPALVSSACKALDLVKRAQQMTSSDPGILGGIGGSDPISGGYVPLAIPNWAAKFFIDALLTKRAALRELVPPERSGSRALLPVKLSRDGVASQHVAGRSPRVVLLSEELSTRVAKVCDAWSTWGFRPDSVVVKRAAEPSRVTRIMDYIREYGVPNFVRRVVRGLDSSRVSTAARSATEPPPLTTEAYCAARGIAMVAVSSLRDADELQRVRALEPDVFVYAGCGILRREALEIPRLGTLNAHMALLPAMRGMNVAEWSILYGVPVGCTVHLIDEGIDTGDILASCLLADEWRTPSSVEELRERVDGLQIELLGTVLQSICASGVLPTRHSQLAGDGRQYFSMHADVRAILQRVLAASAEEQQHAHNAVDRPPSEATENRYDAGGNERTNRSAVP